LKAESGLTQNNCYRAYAGDSNHNLQESETVEQDINYLDEIGTNSRWSCLAW